MVGRAAAEVFVVTDSAAVTGIGAFVVEIGSGPGKEAVAETVAFAGMKDCFVLVLAAAVEIGFVVSGIETEVVVVQIVVVVVVESLTAVAEDVELEVAALDVLALLVLTVFRLG